MYFDVAYEFRMHIHMLSVLSSGPVTQFLVVHILMQLWSLHHLMELCIRSMDKTRNLAI